MNVINVVILSSDDICLVGSPSIKPLSVFQFGDKPVDPKRESGLRLLQYDTCFVCMNKNNLVPINLTKTFPSLTASPTLAPGQGGTPVQKRERNDRSNQSFI